MCIPDRVHATLVLTLCRKIRIIKIWMGDDTSNEDDDYYTLLSTF